MYLFIIFTLDGGRDHYNTPEYVPVVILLSAILLWIVMSFTREWRIVLPIILLVGIVLIGDYSKWRYDYFEAIHPADIEWGQIADKYRDCDCLCIGMDELHTMDYSFYEVAQYDEVKVVDATDYDPSGIDALLIGRKTDSPGIIAYISENLQMPEDTILLSTWNGMNCIYMEKNNE